MFPPVGGLVEVEVPRPRSMPAVVVVIAVVAVVGVSPLVSNEDMEVELAEVFGVGVVVLVTADDGVMVEVDEEGIVDADEGGWRL